MNGSTGGSRVGNIRDIGFSFLTFHFFARGAVQIFFRLTYYRLVSSPLSNQVKLLLGQHSKWKMNITRKLDYLLLQCKQRMERLNSEIQNKYMLT